jgi:hypothetical protein
MRTNGSSAMPGVLVLCQGHVPVMRARCTPAVLPAPVVRRHPALRVQGDVTSTCRSCGIHSESVDVVAAQYTLATWQRAAQAMREGHLPAVVWCEGLQAP